MNDAPREPTFYEIYHSLQRSILEARVESHELADQKGVLPDRGELSEAYRNAGKNYVMNSEFEKAADMLEKALEVDIERYLADPGAAEENVRKDVVWLRVALDNSDRREEAAGLEARVNERVGKKLL